MLSNKKRACKRARARADKGRVHEGRRRRRLARRVVKGRERRRVGAACGRDERQGAGCEDRRQEEPERAGKRGFGQNPVKCALFVLARERCAVDVARRGRCGCVELVGLCRRALGLGRWVCFWRGRAGWRIGVGLRAAPPSEPH